MSTRRARKHQWIVFRQKKFRYFKRNLDSYYHVWSDLRMSFPRWRAVRQVQTENEHMVSVLHPVWRNLSQSKTEIPGLLRFVNPPAGWQQWNGEKHDN